MERAESRGGPRGVSDRASQARERRGIAGSPRKAQPFRGMQVRRERPMSARARRECEVTEHRNRANEVRLRMPADGAFVSALRTLTAGLAARCDLTIDQIEDLRIAVDEACSLLLPHGVAPAHLTADFTLEPGAIRVVASVPADPSAKP